jgi:PHD/YefM family antitoxin component YafN of YafNO toxin-antitoxin module
MTPSTQFLTDHTGHKTAVVVPLIEYESLLEDLHDLAIIAERRDEPRSSLEDVKNRLKADGFLQD